MLRKFKNPLNRQLMLVNEEEFSKYVHKVQKDTKFDTLFCQENVQQHLSYVEVYMAPPMAMRITRHLRATFPQRIADIGTLCTPALKALYNDIQ